MEAAGRSWQVVVVQRSHLMLKLLGRVLEWSLLTGGRYSEVVVNTGLTVPVFDAAFTLCIMLVKARRTLNRLVVKYGVLIYF